MDQLRRPEPLQYDGARSLGSNMKIPYRMDAEQTRGCLVSPSTSRLTWPPQPSTHGSCRVWRPADRWLQSPSFLPSHQEWYSLFLISSSFSMYLVILLPRKRRHILDMLYCWEMGIIVNSGWEWAPPQFLCPVTRECGTTGKWATRQLKKRNQGKALVQVYCPNQCLVSGNTDDRLQPLFPCITLLESEVSSSSYPPKPFVVRYTEENEERSNHLWMSKICLCGCPSNSFHSTLSLWLPLPPPCIPLFMLMLQPEPDHTIWALAFTMDLVCTTEHARPSCFMVWFCNTQP